MRGEEQHRGGRTKRGEEMRTEARTGGNKDKVDGTLQTEAIGIGKDSGVRAGNTGKGGGRQEPEEGSRLARAY